MFGRVLRGFLWAGSLWAAGFVSAGAMTPPDLAPRSAPPAYATPNYGLTFQVPRGLSYCPLPDGWTGSDHGTTLFLAPPKQCGGYPSSSRTYAPGLIPHVDIYYGWWLDDGAFPAHPCRRPYGSIRVFGRLYPVCPLRRDGLVGVEIHGQYSLAHSDDAEAVFTLLTTSRRLPRDLKMFKALVMSVRTCTVPGEGERFGTGAPCPKGISWF